MRTFVFALAVSGAAAFAPAGRSMSMKMEGNPLQKAAAAALAAGLGLSTMSPLAANAITKDEIQSLSYLQVRPRDFGATAAEIGAKRPLPCRSRALGWPTAARRPPEKARARSPSTARSSWWTCAWNPSSSWWKRRFVRRFLLRNRFPRCEVRGFHPFSPSAGRQEER
eukprot:scaffold3305_cov328-Pinguiococcus_pyrenoidosus.AAC.3